MDTNIILEILEKRSRLQATLSILSKYAHQPASITTLTLSNVFYMSERSNADIRVTESLLRSYKIISVTDQDALWAFDAYDQNDYEDALQVAAAVREGCTAFVTLDAELSKKYRAYLNIELVR